MKGLAVLVVVHHKPNVIHSPLVSAAGAAINHELYRQKNNYPMIILAEKMGLAQNSGKQAFNITEVRIQQLDLSRGF
jgi:hypothetical protein